MAIELVVPNVGEGGMELRFAGWLKAEGDQVAAGEEVFEIDTDKLVVAIEAYQGGILADLRVRRGDVVERGQVVALLVSGGDEATVQPERADS